MLHLKHFHYASSQRFVMFYLFLAILKQNVVLSSFSKWLSPPCRVSLLLFKSLHNNIVFLPNPYHGFSNATPLPPTCLLPSTNRLLPSNKGNLEDLFTTSVVGPLFFPFWRISKSFWIFQVSSMNTTTSFLLRFSLFFKTSIYIPVYFHNVKEAHIWFILHQIYPSSCPEPLYIQCFLTHACVQRNASSRSTFFWV